MMIQAFSVVINRSCYNRHRHILHFIISKISNEIYISFIIQLNLPLNFQARKLLFSTPPHFKFVKNGVTTIDLNTKKSDKHQFLSPRSCHPNTASEAFLTIKPSDQSGLAPRNPNSTIVWDNSENN